MDKNMKERIIFFKNIHLFEPLTTNTLSLPILTSLINGHQPDIIMGLPSFYHISLKYGVSLVNVWVVFDSLLMLLLVKIPPPLKGLSTLK